MKNKWFVLVLVLMSIIPIAAQAAYHGTATGAQIDAAAANAAPTANMTTNTITAFGNSTKIPMIVTGTLNPDWTGTYAYLDQYNGSNRYYNATHGVYIWRSATPPAFGFWHMNTTPGASNDAGWYAGGSVNNYTVPYKYQSNLGWGSYAGYTGTATVAPLTRYSLNITGGVGIAGMQGILYPDQSVLYDSLFIGNGGGNTTHLTGVYDNPLDPISSDGSYNGLYNTFIGVYAGYSNQTGNLNLFVGSSAGKANTNGTQNTYIGHAAGLDSTSGYHNTYVGVGAAQANTTGKYNVEIGTDSGLTGTDGSYNTFVGTGSGGAGNVQDSSTYIGYCSGCDGGGGAAAGDNNVFVGASTTPAAAADTNSIVIGKSAAGAGSNSIQMGNADVTKLCFANSSICWFKGTGAPSAGLCVAGNIGSLYSNVSGGASTTLYVCTDAATWTAK
jgi:hypothetical protein